MESPDEGSFSIAPLCRDAALAPGHRSRIAVRIAHEVYARAPRA
ncbi:hypothetical protein DB32_000530 [Sandaracinus amylolyticus]|uniref:Uncharacterized protein n=1 Tax=Sandaracinus amylolyticus TaxID=927083 RepID=A0A0F6VZ70_9BACT|nr:hypothetical protein DB32_000530 [Sandaracinus amylolyticus]